MPLQESGIFHSSESVLFFQFPRSPLKRRQGVHDRRRNARTQTSVKVQVGDESNGSEASEALMFCFENASPGSSCFVVDLFRFISLCLRVAVFLKATRRDRNLPPFTSKGK